MIVRKLKNDSLGTDQRKVTALEESARVARSQTEVRWILLHLEALSAIARIAWKEQGGQVTSERTTAAAVAGAVVPEAFGAVVVVFVEEEGLGEVAGAEERGNLAAALSVRMLRA